MIENGHGGDIFGLPKDERESFLDFSININPLGMSPKGKDAMLAHLDTDAARYPDVLCRDMKQALAERYGIQEDGITCGNGATELMYTFARVFKPSAVYVPAPSFSEYRLSAEAAGIPVSSFLLDAAHGFRPLGTHFLEQIRPHSLIYLGNPNNPDGQLLGQDVLEMIIERAEEMESQVIVDESFIDFVSEKNSVRHYIRQHPCLSVIMSLTKFYAVPGLRIGILFSSSPVAEVIQNTLYPWNVNGLVQRYIAEAVKDQIYIDESIGYVDSERARLESILSSCEKLTVYPSTVNFILLRLKEHTARWLQTELLPRHMMIRQCGNYECLDDSFFRIAVRKQEDNDCLLKALKEVLHT